MLKFWWTNFNLSGNIAKQINPPAFRVLVKLNSAASLRNPLHRGPAGPQAVPLYAGSDDQWPAALGASGESLWPGSAGPSRKPPPVSHLQRQDSLPRGAEEVLPRGGEGHRRVLETGQGGIQYQGSQYDKCLFHLIELSCTLASSPLQSRAQGLVSQRLEKLSRPHISRDLA